MVISKAENIQVVLVQKNEMSHSGNIACPNHTLNMPKWASHPLVYLPLGQEKQVTCPYCSTIYKLSDE